MFCSVSHNFWEILAKSCVDDTEISEQNKVIVLSQ